jgi:hypothetical protein
MTRDEPIEVPQVPWPKDFVVWNDQTPTVEFTGREQLEFNELHDLLQLKTSRLLQGFCSADPDEIAARQAITSDLLADDSLRQALQELPVHNGTLPQHGYEFIDTYDGTEANPFWQMVQKFCDIMAASSNVSSHRLSTLHQVLANSMSFREVEFEVARKVLPIVKGAVIARGVFRLQIELMPGGDVASRYHTPDAIELMGGYRRWFSGQNQLYVRPPAWVTRGYDSRVMSVLTDTVEIFYELRDIANVLFSRNAQKIEDDTLKGLVRHITENLREQLVAVWPDANKSGDDGARPGEYEFLVMVNHDKDGTRYRILKTQYDAPAPNIAISDEQNVYGGSEELWPHGYQRKIRKLLDNAHEDQKAAWRWEHGMRLRTALRDAGFDTDAWHNVPTNWAKELQHIQRVSDVWCMPHVRDATEAVQQFRNDAVRHIADVKAMAKYIQNQLDLAKQHGLPVSLPTRVEEGHIVAFDALAPIHVLAHPDVTKVSLITNLQPLSRKLIMMTGDHGAGKTVTSIVLPVMTYLNQSGMLTFGTNVLWSLRKTVMAALLDKKVGKSTMVDAGETLAKMLEAVRTGEREHMLLVIDELGSATEHTNGVTFSRPILSAFNAAGVDVYVTTQSEEVARVAEDLGATCYRIDRKHHIELGIGRANIEQLMEETGVNRELQLLEAELQKA